MGPSAFRRGRSKLQDSWFWPFVRKSRDSSDAQAYDVVEPVGNEDFHPCLLLVMNGGEVLVGRGAHGE